MVKTLKRTPVIISIGMIIFSFYIIYNYYDEESLMNEISVSGKKVAEEAGAEVKSLDDLRAALDDLE